MCIFLINPVLSILDLISELQAAHRMEPNAELVEKDVLFVPPPKFSPVRSFKWLLPDSDAERTPNVVEIFCENEDLSSHFQRCF